jgi:hypothetical protein
MENVGSPVVHLPEGFHKELQENGVAQIQQKMVDFQTEKEV